MLLIQSLVEITSKINKPMRPGRKTVEEWLKFVVENQFTLQEIEDGVNI